MFVGPDVFHFPVSRLARAVVTTFRSSVDADEHNGTRKWQYTGVLASRTGCRKTMRVKLKSIFPRLAPGRMTSSLTHSGKFYRARF